MDDLDRKALYWCLKLSRMADYNQLFMNTDPVEVRKGVDHETARFQKNCLDESSTVMMALGRDLDIYNET